jgi:hypothetical protein
MKHAIEKLQLSKHKATRQRDNWKARALAFEKREAGLRYAVEQAIHVLEMPREKPTDKATDIGVALTWLQNGMAGIYDKQTEALQ